MLYKNLAKKKQTFHAVVGANVAAHGLFILPPYFRRKLWGQNQVVANICPRRNIQYTFQNQAVLMLILATVISMIYDFTNRIYLNTVKIQKSKNTNYTYLFTYSRWSSRMVAPSGMAALSSLQVQKETLHTLVWYGFHCCQVANRQILISAKTAKTTF
jgi:hypothetical protein